MGKRLVLTEKPSIGRDIAKILGCYQKGNGFFSGPNYIVTWADEHHGIVVIKETSKQFRIVKNLMRQQDLEEAFVSTE